MMSVHNLMWHASGRCFKRADFRSWLMPKSATSVCYSNSGVAFAWQEAGKKMQCPQIIEIMNK